jgi:predicted SprT family Zn-dependent metalloprotease
MQEKQARLLARKEMNQNGLSHWSIKLGNGKRQGGLCNYTEKYIQLSRYMISLNDEETVHQIILHEIAHALTDPRDNHGPRFRRVARSLGVRGPFLNACGNFHTPEGRYQATCDACGRKHSMHRRPKNRKICKCRRGSTLAFRDTKQPAMSSAA